MRPSTSVSAARAAADPVMGSRPLSSEGRRAQSSSSSAQVSLLGYGQRLDQPQEVRREQRQAEPRLRESSSVSTSSSGPPQQQQQLLRPPSKKKKKKSHNSRKWKKRKRK